MPALDHPLAIREDGKIDIKCMDWPTFRAWCDERGIDAPRAARVFKQIWKWGLHSFGHLPQMARWVGERLEADAYLAFLTPELVLRSEDGTVKFLWSLEDGHTIESVLIPDGEKLTLCMSSQVGCAMGCTFCLTGDLGLVRHLKASEIANQAAQVQRWLPEGAMLSNLVLMGMGEPVHNLEALVPALSICMQDLGLHISHRKITVSTVGHVKGMQALAERLPVNIAVSLNASSQASRARIMPIARRYDLDTLIAACRSLPMPPGKRIQFEYVLFAGDNDTPEDAERLVALLGGFPCKVNLIPYNENPARTLRAPSRAVVLAFRDRLRAAGISTSVRATRGRDVSAACGQLGKAWSQASDNGWLERARAQAGEPQVGLPVAERR